MTCPDVRFLPDTLVCDLRNEPLAKRWVSSVRRFTLPPECAATGCEPLRKVFVVCALCRCRPAPRCAVAHLLPLLMFRRQHRPGRRCAFLHLFLTLVMLLTAGLVGCGEEQKQRTEPLPRPVTVERLERTSPGGRGMFAGIVEAWASEDIASEVSGRIEFVVDEGERVEGRWVENGDVIIRGDVLARIDAATYIAAVRSAEAEVRRLQVQRDVVVPAQVAEARTALEREKAELERLERAAAQEAANELQLILARASVEIAESTLESAEASLEQARANILAAEAELERAQLQRERTTIHAPFTGEVTRIYREAGGYAGAGTPIARLVMLDPVRVLISASPKAAREIREGEDARVHVEGIEPALRGRVYRVSATADPTTLTFDVTVLARNYLLHAPPEGGPTSDDGVKIIEGVFAAQPEEPNNPDSPLFVPEQRVLRSDTLGSYVWTLDPVGTSGARTAPDASLPGAGHTNGPTLYRARRVAVTPGSTRRNYQGIVIGRTLIDAGPLEAYDPLAVDPPSDLSEGDLVRVAPRDWAIRPGDVVEVDLPSRTAPRGYYVPASAVRYESNTRGTIFIVQDDRRDDKNKDEDEGADTAVARAVRIQLGPMIDNQQQIAPPPSPDDSTIDLNGAWLITEGAQYLENGERIRMIRGTPDRTRAIPQPFITPESVDEAGVAPPAGERSGASLTQFARRRSGRP